MSYAVNQNRESEVRIIDKLYNENSVRASLFEASVMVSQLISRLPSTMVSQTPGKEYDEKLDIHQRLGVLYYVIYNPWYWERNRHQPFEVY